MGDAAASGASCSPSGGSGATWSSALSALIQCGNLQDVEEHPPPVPLPPPVEVRGDGGSGGGGVTADMVAPRGAVTADMVAPPAEPLIACSTRGERRPPLLASAARITRPHRWRTQLESISPIADDGGAFWRSLRPGDIDDDAAPEAAAFRPGDAPAGDPETPASVIRFLTCVGEEGKTYDEVVSYLCRSL